MNFFKTGSIGRNLILLVVAAVLPALAILLYTGLEQRDRAIANAKQEVMLLTNSMAEGQKDMTNAARQILSTLSLLPAIRGGNLEVSEQIITAVLEQNPDFYNITLTDLQGDVLLAGGAFVSANLADRKHFREALAKQDFAAGEYIIARVGATDPAFAFAHPVFDWEGRPVAVLTIAVYLNRFARFYDAVTLPADSFVAVTDHRGIRLFYHPPRDETNPVGQPIAQHSWERARAATGQDIFVGEGSDGIRRIFAFRPVSLTPDEEPYAYLWAGISESHVLAPARAVLQRNLLLLALATSISLAVAWLLGRRNLVAPITSLVNLTRQYAAGRFEARLGNGQVPAEIATLTRAFHDMAAGLETSQQILRENEARFRLLMNSLDAVVHVVDMETYEILFINETGKRQFGDVTGKICWQVLHKDQTGPCAFCTNRFLLDEKGQPGAASYAWEKENSVTGKWYSIRDRAIKWVDGRIVLLEVATDITEQKRNEQELMKVKKLESIGVLAGGLAHDFNNILTAILGNIQLVLQDRQLAEESGKLLREAAKASLRAKSLTQQLLTFAKGGQPIRAAASLAEVIKDSADFVLRGSKVACRYDLPDDLWLVDIDKGQISQVIQNLILNASQAMPDGGTIEVSGKNLAAGSAGVALPGQGDYVRMTISDHGVGIPANALERIFDPYFSTKQLGSGLGLAISHSIVSKHDGRITVRSTPGKGTTFEVYLPVALEAAEAGGAAEDFAAGGKKVRILVMDDEEMIRKVAQSVLTKMGHEVVPTTEGKEAVAGYREAMEQGRPFDLVIMDLTVPGGMGGREAMEEILALDPEAKAVVASGYSHDPVMANYSEYGFSASLSKPFDLQELERVLNKVLG